MAAKIDDNRIDENNAGSASTAAPRDCLQHRFLQTLDILVLRRRDDGAFETLMPVPGRFASIYPECKNASEPLFPQEKFPFVENFLEDAEELWDTGGNSLRAHSGPWIEPTGADGETALEAIAINLDDERLLILKILEDGYELQQKVLQIGRENALLSKRLEQQWAPLKTLMEHMDSGVQLLDDELRVVIANQNASRLLGLPKDFLAPGTRLAEVIRYQYEHGEFADTQDTLEQAIESRLRYFDDDRQSFRYEHLRADGSCLDVRYARLPDGGWIGTETDITELKRIEQVKSDFLSTVSHELRTPLTSIRGALDLVNAGALGNLPREALDMLQVAHNNSERLLRLIDDLLDIQKLESDELSMNFAALPIAPFVRQALADNKGYALDRGVEFVLKLEASDGAVYADGVRLGQVMSNLLSNAAKFSPRGASVEIFIAETAAGRIRVSVADCGAGIADDFRHRIFDRFTQSDSSATREKGGTGLGLAISRAIVERHGGQLGFVSRPGDGSVFYFELPRHPAADHEAADKPGAEATAVLIVEGDTNAAGQLQRLLTQYGYHADIAGGAQQARKLLQQRTRQYALIALDMDSPGAAGLDLPCNAERRAKPPRVVGLAAAEPAAAGSARLDALLLKSRLYHPESIRIIEDALSR